MDDATTSYPKFSCSQRFFTAYSFKKCCYFLVAFFLLIALLLGAAAFVIIVIVKPQKPLFSIQTVKIESYKLDVESGRDLFVSSVVSFTLNAENPNRVGITYGTSRLHVLDEGLVIGMIRVPRFHQPPQSKNISVDAQVIFECVNVTEIASGKPMQENSTSGLFQIRIVGDVKAQVRIVHLTLPDFRVAMDCDITIDHRYVTFSSAIFHSFNTAKNQKISLPANSRLILSKKCSIALYV